MGVPCARVDKPYDCVVHNGAVEQFCVTVQPSSCASCPGACMQADSAHWVLMEIVERRTGLDFRDYLRTKVLVRFTA